jgi:hypothetical protein
MMEVEVTLDFICCLCDQSVNVVVRCTGAGLAAGPGPVAAVSIPCPSCGLVNQLTFEPSGTVRSVTPYHSPRRAPEPSLN